MRDYCNKKPTFCNEEILKRLKRQLSMIAILGLVLCSCGNSAKMMRGMSNSSEEESSTPTTTTESVISDVMPSTTSVTPSGPTPTPTPTKSVINNVILSTTPVTPSGPTSTPTPTKPIIPVTPSGPTSTPKPTTPVTPSGPTSTPTEPTHPTTTNDNNGHEKCNVDEKLVVQWNNGKFKEHCLKEKNLIDAYNLKEELPENFEKCKIPSRIFYKFIDDVEDRDEKMDYELAESYCNLGESVPGSDVELGIVQKRIIAKKTIYDFSNNFSYIGFSNNFYVLRHGDWSFQVHTTKKKSDSSTLQYINRGVNEQKNVIQNYGSGMMRDENFLTEFEKARGRDFAAIIGRSNVKHPYSSISVKICLETDTEYRLRKEVEDKVREFSQCEKNAKSSDDKEMEKSCRENKDLWSKEKTRFEDQNQNTVTFECTNDNADADGNCLQICFYDRSCIYQK